MIVEDISNFTGLSPESVEKIANKAPNTYKRYTVPKNSGGRRVIYQPSRETKSIQYAIVEIMLNDLRVHDVAMAYRPGVKSPQRKTAEKHAPYSYSLRIDFEQFFYSIRPHDLFNCLDNNDESKTDKEESFLEMALFINHHSEFKLAIGAPTSPFISNSVVFRVDRELLSRAKDVDPDSALTRYADDIVFSTDEQGSCRDFLEEARQVLNSMDWPSLSLNESKTTFMSRGTKRMVAGLILTPDGDVSIGRDKKRAIRSWLNDLKYENLDEEEIRKLQGYLAWIKDVEPELLNRLSLKYTSDLVNRAMGGGS